MNVYMIRDVKSASHTGSQIMVGGEHFVAIERPWLNNVNNISCIPTGEYNCVYLERSASGKYRNIYHVQDVPGRSGILIHNGNLASHSKGCIIIGKRRGVLVRKPAVLNSRTALQEFVTILDKKPFKLFIV